MTKIGAKELLEKYRRFFESKGHKWIPSSPLPTQEDPSTLFITAGMQPLVPYLLGQKHEMGKRLVNVQECVRTGDIEEVGDTYHHTWFEMLGHWSLGDYFKKEAIEMTYQFLTKELGLDKNRLAFSVFGGNENAKKDEEAANCWLGLGVSPKRIAYLSENWWELSSGGPCGPSTEMFYWWDNSEPVPEKFDPTNEKWLEIGNDVLMQYQKEKEGVYKSAKQRNIDNGTGVERTLAAINGFDDNYRTDIFWPIVEKIVEVSGKSYGEKEAITKPIRIIADHVRSAVFIIADGIVPSNKEAGYVLRRLIRRSIRQGKILGINKNFIKDVAETVLDNQDNYANTYSELNENKDRILEVLVEEEEKFGITLVRGLKKVNEMISNNQTRALDIFNLYQTYGFPLELIEEELGKKFDSNFLKEFEEIKKGHQKLSRVAGQRKFKGGLAGHSEKMTQYHTATHLLQAVLREELGDHVYQMGSNITEERLRFDFPNPTKLTDEQKKNIEERVNQIIKDNLIVKMETMSKEEAKSRGFLMLPGKDYPPTVNTYSIDDFSKEVCGGPHVKTTGELSHFKISREESCGTGKRRIYGILN